MKIAKIILGFLLIFTLVFTVGKITVLATGYTDAQIQTEENGWYPDGHGGYIYEAPEGCASGGCTGDPWQGTGTYAGYYESNGLYYPIGTGSNNNGDGPAGPNCTRGTYGNCTLYGACSPTCGTGSQSRTCYDL